MEDPYGRLAALLVERGIQVTREDTKAIANAAAYGKVLSPEAMDAVKQWNQEHRDELDDARVSRMSEIADTYCTALAALHAQITEADGYQPMDQVTQYLVAAQLTSAFVLSEAIGQLEDALAHRD